MKRRYDVGTDLKPAKASIRFSLYPHRTAPDDLDLMPFLSRTSRDDLQEVEEDLKFISGKDSVDHQYIVEALLQFYLIETTKRPRVRVAADLHKAAQFAYRRMRRHKEALCDEYEALAERLLDALN